MTEPARIVVVEVPVGSPAAAMRIGGMTVLERVVRTSCKAGAARVLVRGAASVTATLPRLGIPVETLGDGEAAPVDAAIVAGDTIAGVRITDEASRRQADRALVQSLRNPYDGVGDRYVTRYVSLQATRLFVTLGLTPNQITLFNIVVGLAACVSAAHGGAAAFALAGGLMFLQLVLDSSDGEVARLRHLSGPAGMYLDNASDDVIDNLFIVCMGLGLGSPWTWVGVAAGLGRGAVALMIFRTVARLGKPGDVMAFSWWFDSASDSVTERFSKPTLAGSMRAIGRRDLYVLVWAAFCIAHLPLLALGLAVGIAITHGTMGLLHVRRRTRAPATAARAD